MSRGLERTNSNCDMHHKICEELTELYRKKNHDYGDSFHASYEKWGLPMAAIRLGDKLSRFETLIKAESEVAESMRDTLIDLANYAIMTVMELDAETKKDNGFRVACPKCGIVDLVHLWEIVDIDPLTDMGRVKCRGCGEMLTTDISAWKIFRNAKKR